MLPELSRRYHLRPSDLDDMTPGELAVYVDDLKAQWQAERDTAHTVQGLARDRKLQIFHDPFRR